MIQLIEAPPRSGKSYYAVNYIMKFVTYDALYKEFVLQPNVLIISNIEGLKVKHWKLSECLKDRSLTEFFSIPNFENIMEKTKKNNVILLIDEAHELFPAGFKSPEIYNFFAYHGHIGLDIFLMTQGFESMSRMFNPLVEFVVKVTPRSKSIMKNFSYGFYDKSGRFMYSKSLMKKQLVFDAYTSFRQDEQNKPKNAVLHWIVITAVFLIVAGGLFKSALAVVANKAKPENARKQMAPSALALQPISSASVPLPVSTAPASAPFQAISTATVPQVQTPFSSDDLPRVIGFVGDANGKNTKYLLTTGQISTCKRQLNIGDIYIK